MKRVPAIKPPSALKGGFPHTAIISFRSGTTYTVIVDTGSGEGVLRLEPAPAAQLVNASGESAGVSAFTDGEIYIIDKTAPAAPVFTGITTNSGANFANNGDNSYHVVTGANGATLDGFTITDGNADGDDTLSLGGGIYNASASPTLAHLVIADNSASNGGGMYNYQSNPALSNVIFSSNTAANGGGGMYNAASSPMLTTITLSNNVAQNGPGGGLFNLNSTATLTYTPKPGAHGTATIGVVVRDSGGTGNGGVDTSAIHMFTITVGGTYQVYLPTVLGAP